MCFFHPILQLLVFLLFFSASLFAQDHENIALVSQTCEFWSDIEDIVISENIAYIAANASGLQILDISDPVNPHIIGFYENITTVATCLFLSGNSIYIGHEVGISIVDVTDPERPELIGDYFFPLPVSDLTVDDSIIYFVAENPDRGNSGGLFILDATRPQDPVLLSEWTVPRNAVIIEKIGSYVYIIGNRVMHVMDITDPEAPERTFFWETDGFESELEVVGDRAYVAIRRLVGRIPRILHSLDVSDPGQPEFVDSIIWDGSPNDIESSNDFLYVTSYLRLSIIDISSDEQFEVAESIRLDYPVGKLAVTENYAYVGDTQVGLHILDISDPFAMEEVGVFESVGVNRCVAYSGDVLYASGEGFRTINIEDPANPHFSRINSNVRLRKMSVIGNKGCGFDNSRSDLSFFDCSDPLQPEQTQSLRFVHMAGGAINDIAIDDEVVFLATHIIHTFDISDINNPTEFEHNLFDELYGHTIKLVDNYLYIVRGYENCELIIVDIADINDLRIVSRIDTPYGIIQFVVVSGDCAVLSSNNHIYCFDVSDPENPEHIGGWHSDDEINNITASDEFLYLAAGETGIIALDISDPEDIQTAGFYNTDGFARDVLVGRNLIIVADDTNVGIYENTLLDTPPHSNQGDYPEGFVLYPAFPNPFNSTTTISFFHPTFSPVKVSVHNTHGQLIEQLVNGVVPAGRHSVVWEANGVSAGVYFVVSGDEIGKILFIK